MKTLVLSAIAMTLMAGSSLATDIQTRTVSFENEGSTLSGTLYLPADHKSGDKLPVVVVTGAWTSVQEQMPANYAREMVERG
ncbi:MAG: alpha/beta hydrolase, partial [Pseudomonadota bacterium]